jgi:hypothetical protein
VTGVFHSAAALSVAGDLSYIQNSIIIICLNIRKVSDFV